MAFSQVAHLANAFGILGNIVSFFVYLAPPPTFYRIFKNKSREGFQSIPYAVALFSAMLYLYYAFLKHNVFLLITINSVECAMEVSYLTIYMIYATKQSRMLLLFNVTLLGFIVACTNFLLKGDVRVKTVGWICAVFSVSVFVAPLSIMLLIKTNSVEFMPLSLSFFLTLCAVMWFFYGVLIQDLFIAVPNVIGFAFGIIQMILYLVYKNKQQQILPEAKVHDFTIKEHDESQENEYCDQDHELEIVVIARVAEENIT